MYNVSVSEETQTISTSNAYLHCARERYYESGRSSEKVSWEIKKTYMIVWNRDFWVPMNRARPISPNNSPSFTLRQKFSYTLQCHNESVPGSQLTCSTNFEHHALSVSEENIHRWTIHLRYQTCCCAASRLRLFLNTAIAKVKRVLRKERWDCSEIWNDRIG